MISFPASGPCWGRNVAVTDLYWTMPLNPWPLLFEQFRGWQTLLAKKCVHNFDMNNVPLMLAATVVWHLKNIFICTVLIIYLHACSRRSLRASFTVENKGLKGNWHVNPTTNFPTNALFYYVAFWGAGLLHNSLIRVGSLGCLHFRTRRWQEHL